MRTCQHSSGSAALTDLVHAAVDHPANCANCGAAVSANFCAACGQETRLHMPSAAEFAHEFVGHYVALEGKLWKTLQLLFVHPGRLTFDYLAGRRARYVQPLRLYLTFSLLFFALIRFSGLNLVEFDQDPPVAQHAGAPAARAQGGEGADGGLASVIALVNPHWAGKGAAFDALSPQAKNKAAAQSFFSYGPYALFCLMPLFGLYLKLLYLGSGRRYGEHLLFALHSNAFAYIILALILLLPFAPVKFALFCWLAAYLPIAMRRVYGGSWWATLLRWLVLMLLHALSIAIAIAAAFALSIVI
jgi:hypothetical protein